MVGFEKNETVRPTFQCPYSQQSAERKRSEEKFFLRSLAKCDVNHWRRQYEILGHMFPGACACTPIWQSLVYYVYV